MTQKARWVWTDVIEREGIPDCPEDMSEPAYLSFLYDEECMVSSGTFFVPIETNSARRVATSLTPRLTSGKPSCV
jgi:hypothetical protein